MDADEIEEQLADGVCPWCPYDRGAAKQHAPVAHPEKWAAFTGKEDAGGGMQRITFRLPHAVVDDIGSLVEAGRYHNRSQFIRSAVRDKLDEEKDRMRREDSPFQHL